MAREMTREETRAFLLAGTRTGKLATTRADGQPHVTPIWFTLDVPSLSPSQGSGFAATVGKAAVAADDMVFTTHETSLKAKGIRRDPRVSVCVDEEIPPYSYVLCAGTATLSDDLGARNGVPGELVVRITPTHVIARADIAD